MSSVFVPSLATFSLLLFGAVARHPPKPKHHRARIHFSRAPRGPHARADLPQVPGSRAAQYSALEPRVCLAMLSERQIPFVREEPKRGVQIPVRLTGKVAGVLYRTDFPDEERREVPWEIFDCRLVLALYDFGETLRAHSVSEVRMFSAWRPPPNSFPAGEWARRHQGALAVDVRELRKEDGEVLSVLEDFHGKLAAPQCTPDAAAPYPDSARARELHVIVCEAAAAHLFNSILTPNYNGPHKNHFHLELTPGVDWFMLR